LPVQNQITSKNDVLTFPFKAKNKLLNRTLAFETNNLINGLIQYDLNNSLLHAKYNPKHQRYLNSTLF
jgi:hypothetical protein